MEELDLFAAKKAKQWQKYSRDETDKNSKFNRTIRAAQALLEREETLAKQEERIEENLKKLDVLNEQFDKHRDNAKREGMSASFDKMHKELNGAGVNWLVFFLFNIIGMIGLAFYLKLDLSDDPLMSLKRLPFFAPLFWFAWVCIRNYGFISRIRQDYAFKLSTAQAYEGYRKEALKLDPELAKELMKVSIEVFSNNPLRFYEGHKNHASPIHELFEGGLDRFKRVVWNSKKGELQVETRSALEKGLDRVKKKEMPQEEEED
ncbi:MAG: hypothetical protein RRB13_07085 [bacterium]|nr:hypothetical protein [bacterium]